jgi:hypothetical protein
MKKILLPAMTVAHLLTTEANIDGGLCPYDIRRGKWLFLYLTTISHPMNEG